MNKLSRGLLVITLMTILVSCSGTQTPSANDSGVTAAREGTQWSVRLARGITDMIKLRPGALLGAYVTHYLIHTSAFQGALAGIEAQMQLLFNEEFEQDESFALLEELGTTLQVDVPDLLNRSIERSQTLNAYVESLEQILERSRTHNEALEQELEIIGDERTQKRRAAGEIQRELNTALREQDYSTAGELQRQLIDAESEQANVESREDEKRSVIRLFEDLLEVGDERLAAIQANREVLIAGVKVVELPGVDDLGLIEQRRTRGRGSSIFGPQ
jgi:hypothetical protein